MGTINNTIELGDAEEFKKPTDGVHPAILDAVSFSPTRKGAEAGPDSPEYREQFVLTFKLADDDTESPGFTLTYYLGWPVPDDKDVKWGNRTAYGSKIQAIKEALTAFGGPESGGLDRKGVEKVFFRSIQKRCKVYVKTTPGKEGGKPWLGVDAIYPA